MADNQSTQEARQSASSDSTTAVQSSSPTGSSSRMPYVDAVPRSR